MIYVERLEEIENRLNALSERFPDDRYETDPQTIDFRWTISRVKKLTDALVQIKFGEHELGPRYIAGKALEEE